MLHGEDPDRFLQCSVHDTVRGRAKAITKYVYSPQRMLSAACLGRCTLCKASKSEQ